MTPHGVLEDMQEAERMLGPRLFHFFAPELWPTVKETLAAAVHFEFGAARPLEQHGQFATQMFDKHLFRLPYHTVFFTSQAMPHSAVLAMQNVDDRPWEFIAITIGPTKGRDMTLNLPLLGMGLYGDSWAESRVDWKSLTSQPHASRKTGRPWGESDYEEACQKVTDFVLGGVALLMSKDVEVRPEPPSAKLNAIRAKRGKPAIGARVVIRMSDKVSALMRDAERARVEGRASPVMHWRRGCFRRLQSGNIIPVSPTIVGARRGAAEPIKKQYVVAP